MGSKNSVTCVDRCFPIGAAIINATFIVGCNTLPKCPSGARVTSTPGTYSMYRNKFRKNL